MAAQRSPEELYPNLFGKPAPARRDVKDMNPLDMRLLQYTLQKHGRKPESRGKAAPVRTFGKA